MSINLGSITLPINAATKTFAILAKRGAGKTYTGGVMAEEFYKAGIPFVVFDPIDVWWGLRLAADGKGKGLPIVVFGLQHADIALDREMGRQIAQAVVKENISCVISTFGMPKVAARHLIAEFAEELLNINNTPRHVFIEEAHEYVPQRVMGAQAKTFAAVEALVTMGRNKGIGVTMLNQRAATINKDVLTQLDTLLAFQNTSPQDRKALHDWVEAQSAEGDFQKFMASLPSLPKGHGWIWSPEFMGVFERIEIRKRETFHPDREKIGDHFQVPKLEQSDIQSFIETFRSAPPPERKEPARPTAKAEAPVEQTSIIELRNEYESKLVAKDIEIRAARDEAAKHSRALDAIRAIVGGAPTTSTAQTGFNGADEWIDKLGRNRAEGKILAFLASSAGLSFTRSQVAIRTGLSSTSGGFGQALATLVKNRLIIRTNGEYRVSTDL